MVPGIDHDPQLAESVDRSHGYYLVHPMHHGKGLDVLPESEIAAPGFGRGSWPDAIEALPAGHLARYQPGRPLAARAVEPPLAGRTPRPPGPLSLALGFRPGHGIPLFTGCDVKRRNLGAGLELVQVVGPGLHHFAALGQVLREIVGCTHGVAFTMGKLAFNGVPVPAQFETDAR